MKSSHGKYFGRPLVMMAAAVALSASAFAIGSLTLGTDKGAEAAGVDSDLRSTMSVFDRERRASDEMPGSAAIYLRRSAEGQPGETPDLSRRIDVAGEAVYVWPMTDGVCDSFGGCTPLRRLRERGVDVGSSFSLNKASRALEDVRVFGIAKDGIRSVEIEVGGANRATARVVENVFVAKLGSARPTRVIWRDVNATHVEDLRIQTPEALLKSLENATAPDSE